MKAKVNQAGSGLPVMKTQNEDISRRQFLQSAAVVGAMVAATPMTGIAQTRQSHSSPELEDPMEEILSRYGSEFGNLNQIG